MKGIIHVRKFGALDFWPIPDEEKVILEFNKVWQPMGTSGLKFRRLAGKYVLAGQFVDLHSTLEKVSVAQKRRVMDRSNGMYEI
jgi:hypothetical protein